MVARVSATCNGASVVDGPVLLAPFLERGPRFLPIQNRGRSLEAAGFALEDVTERGPYLEVEHQTRRAYISARKLQSMALIRRARQADLESVRTCLS